VTSYTRAQRSIAGNTRRLRLGRGWTQAKLAEEAKLDPTFIQRVERATVNLSVRALTSIADALGVRPVELFRLAEPRLAQAGRPRGKKKTG
jgi:transcriptional regulator with XRE-family HTH domain